MRLPHCCVATCAIPQRTSVPYVSVTSRYKAAHKNRTTVMYLTKLIHFLRAWRKYNASVRELSSLGDRELADIGISRSDIPMVAWTSSEAA